MQLPFTGKIGSAGIDKAKATARISALVAQTHGGAKGLILGTFFDIAGGSIADDPPPPPPTTNPLPWASQVTPQENKKPEKKQNISEKLTEKAS